MGTGVRWGLAPACSDHMRANMGKIKKEPDYSGSMKTSSGGLQILGITVVLLRPREIINLPSTTPAVRAGRKP